MTIKEVETLTGITKANIRFYEKEGLLAPGRSSNNYREYSEDDVEHLRKIRIFRIMGFSVAQIRQLADQPQRAAVLMEARAGQIQKEVKELERVRQVCLEVRDSGWRFDTLDPQLLEMAKVFRLPLGRRLLRRGQKARPLRQIPPPALFIFVPDPAQQQSLIAVCRQPVQHFPFIHGIPPDSGCDRVRHRPRLPPAAADGCPARRCGRPGSPGCGGRPGWWRAGGR